MFRKTIGPRHITYLGTKFTCMWFQMTTNPTGPRVQVRCWDKYMTVETAVGESRKSNFAIRSHRTFDVDGFDVNLAEEKAISAAKEQGWM